MRAGWHAVSARQMTARQFNEYWVSLERFNLMQSDDGKKKLKLRADIRQAVALDNATLSSGEYGTAMMRANPPQVVPDPATTSIPWQDASTMLALLPDDDPRAIYLRAGGRLDASGNPILPTT